MPVFRNASWAQRVAPRSGRVDLTDVPLRMQIKAARGNEAAALVTLTTENGGITLVDPQAGVFDLAMSETDTAKLAAGTLFFDIVRTDVHARLFGGRIIVEEGVTT